MHFVLLTFPNCMDRARRYTPIMEKHRPVKDLPEDIKQLPHEETVCKFCGVSYLVHHEIAKLEDKVEKLQEEVNRLKHIESEKDSWKVEKTKLENVLKRTLEEQTLLQSTLDGKEGELNQVMSQYGTLKQENEKLKTESKSMRYLIVEHMDKLKKDIIQLRQYGFKVHQLLSGHALCISQLKEKCLARCLSFDEESRQVRLQLTSEIKNLQGGLNYQRKQEAELKQLLKEEQASCQHYRVQTQELLLKVENWGKEFTTKDAQVTTLTKELRLVKEEAQSLERKLKARTEENASVLRKTMSLKSELEESKVNKRSVQKALEIARDELKSFQQTCDDKEKVVQALKISLENCQQELSKTQDSTRLLHLEHAQQLEATKKEHATALDNQKKTLIQEHKKVLQEIADSNCATLNDTRARLTQMKSLLSANELEKTRLVSSLTEQLKKEKDIADRELTEHLETVKSLELSLLHEQRTRQDLEDKFTTKNDEIQHTMDSLVQTKQELENRLDGAYREISTLQAIVERECEEREKLIEELTKVKEKVKTRKSSKH